MRLLGYARVSTQGQDLEPQLRQLAQSPHRLKNGQLAERKVVAVSGS